MPIRGRVGRHTRLHGRHCQNWTDDQKTVIALLNQIDFRSGGAEGSLGTQVMNGVCSAKLYSAISRFEDKYFPGQRSGFIDPGGKMLRRMEELSARGPKITIVSVTAIPKSFLPDLHASLLDDTQVRGRWAAGEQVAVDALVKMGINHVDRLITTGLTDLPWPAELFGRGYITRFDPLASWSSYGTELTSGFRSARLRFSNPDFDSKDPDAKGYQFEAKGAEAPPLPEMKFGYPVPLDFYITTAHLPALLLFKEGWCVRVPPYASGRISRANRWGYRFPTERPTPGEYEPDRIIGRSKP